MPKVETGHGDEDGDEAADLFEGELEEALCVFKQGNNNKDSDILVENEAQLMFFIDLENETIVAKDATADEGGDLEEEIQGSKHPMFLNQYPLCKNHSMFLLFAEEGLPQVLSDELILMVLQLFKLSSNPSMRIGYNSMGADCSMNNLHFHILSAGELF